MLARSDLAEAHHPWSQAECHVATRDRGNSTFVSVSYTRGSAGDRLHLKFLRRNSMAGEPRRQPVHARDGPWRPGGDVPCQHLRSRGARPRRARGHGRDLLRRRCNPADRRSGQIAGLGDRDRQRCRRRARGSDHPDWIGPRIDFGSDCANVSKRADHSRRRRSRQRYRRHLQHADRRRLVRNRIDLPEGSVRTSCRRTPGSGRLLTATIGSV